MNQMIMHFAVVPVRPGKLFSMEFQPKLRSEQKLVLKDTLQMFNRLPELRFSLIVQSFEAKTPSQRIAAGSEIVLMDVLCEEWSNALWKVIGVTGGSQSAPCQRNGRTGELEPKQDVCPSVQIEACRLTAGDSDLFER
jgi:hypothetical protein